MGRFPAAVRLPAADATSARNSERLSQSAQSERQRQRRRAAPSQRLRRQQHAAGRLRGQRGDEQPLPAPVRLSEEAALQYHPGRT